MRPERFITGLAGANNELDLAWGLKQKRQFVNGTRNTPPSEIIHSNAF